MRKIPAIALICTLAWAVSDASASEQAATAPSPAVSDAKIVELAETCLHLAGEIAGDRSEHDQEVSQQIKKLDCRQAIRQLKALKARLPEDSALQPRIRELLEAM